MFQIKMWDMQKKIWKSVNIVHIYINFPKLGKQGNSTHKAN